MKLTLTKAEISEVKKMLVSLDENPNKVASGIVKESNGNINISINMNGEVTIEVNPAYMSEFLNTYGRYIPAIFSQFTGLVHTIKLMNTDCNTVIRKYKSKGVRRVAFYE